MFCRYGMTFSMNYQGKTELASGELVNGNYFPVLGVGAALGRVFSAQDDLRQGGHPVAVLSYGYWKTRFAGDPKVLGRIDDRRHRRGVAARRWRWCRRRFPCCC